MLIQQLNPYPSQRNNLRNNKMEYIEITKVLKTYRYNTKKSYKWLEKQEKEGYKFQSSESLARSLNPNEPDLTIIVTKLEEFKL